MKIVYRTMISLLALAAVATTVDARSAKLVSENTMKLYKQATWQKYLVARKSARVFKVGNGGPAEIPPTDCPPAPTQDCLDSWEIKTINPLE